MCSAESLHLWSQNNKFSKNQNKVLQPTCYLLKHFTQYQENFVLFELLTLLVLLKRAPLGLDKHNISAPSSGEILNQNIDLPIVAAAEFWLCGFCEGFPVPVGGAPFPVAGAPFPDIPDPTRDGLLSGRSVCFCICLAKYVSCV